MEDSIYNPGQSYGIWMALLLEYVHTGILFGLFLAMLYRGISNEGYPASVWLVLLRCFDALLFSMSNLPAIARILYILSAKLTAPYLGQIIVTYTAFTFALGLMVSFDWLHRGNAARYMACQTAASVYILIRLAVVLRGVVRRPPTTQRLRIRYLNEQSSS